MAEYDTIQKDTLEYTRNLLRNDGTLTEIIFGFSGTIAAINHIFIGRPSGDKVNSNNEPNFPLPRIIIDPINMVRGKIGNNQDGENESAFDLQISYWTDERPWDLSIRTSDRIQKILENDNMPVTRGWARFEILSSNNIIDPDRRQTRLGTIRARTIIEGGAYN